jgi:sulfite reductase beta subunit-like hemoprotein
MPHDSSLNETVRAEIDAFKGHIQAFESDELDDAAFRPIRLIQGVYGQRQADANMMRIKIPGGRLSSEQARAFAEIVQAWAPKGVSHLTTRQAVQIHYVRLEDVPKVMERAEAAGLTTREACGNAIRTITCSPLAGIEAGEAFDPYPYAEAAFRHFLRRPEFARLPRKFKIAFSGSDADSAQTAINDLGFVARVRSENGQIQRGFKVRVGGGLGASPQNAWIYSEFVPENRVLPLATAVLLHFDEKGERQNRMQARLKFLIRKEGFEAFREAVADKLRGLPECLPFPLAAAESEPQGDLGARPPQEGPGAYRTWLAHNTFAQRQAGFHAALVRLELGDLTWGQWLALADLAERWGAGTLRTTNDQNLVIPFVDSRRLADLYEGLNAAGLGALGPGGIRDVTSCPGASTCALALTASKALASKVGETLDGFLEEPELAGTRVRISGCPNSCGQHPIGTFGFHGQIRKIGEQAAPYYQFLIGGGIGSEGAVFGRVVGRVPARRAPLAVRAFVEAWRKTRVEGQSLETWLRQLPLDAAKSLLEPVASLPDDDPEHFKDNGSEEIFVPGRAPAAKP